MKVTVRIMGKGGKEIHCWHCQCIAGWTLEHSVYGAVDEKELIIFPESERMPAFWAILPPKDWIEAGTELTAVSEETVGPLDNRPEWENERHCVLVFKDDEVEWKLYWDMEE